jgi:hypothetical protein
VVIADLRVNGVSHGPHPFFLKLRESAGGKLVQGITIEDMGCRHTNTHAHAPTRTHARRRPYSVPTAFAVAH